MRASLLLLAGLCLSCRTEQDREAERRRAARDQGSAAYKAGQAAHELAEKAAKAAAAAGRQLDDAARKAHEGWRDQEKKDREKGR
jgi:hypothetical protein